MGTKTCNLKQCGNMLTSKTHHINVVIKDKDFKVTGEITISKCYNNICQWPVRDILVSEHMLSDTVSGALRQRPIMNNTELNMKI